jgi:hypothetical protein
VGQPDYSAQTANTTRRPPLRATHRGAQTLQRTTTSLAICWRGRRLAELTERRQGRDGVVCRNPVKRAATTRSGPTCCGPAWFFDAKKTFEMIMDLQVAPSLTPPPRQPAARLDHPACAAPKTLRLPQDPACFAYASIEGRRGGRKRWQPLREDAPSRKASVVPDRGGSAGRAKFVTVGSDSDPDGVLADDRRIVVDCG